MLQFNNMICNDNDERDPAKARAIDHSHRGFTQEVEDHRTRVLPHPSRGGSRGYPMWERTGPWEPILQHRTTSTGMIPLDARLSPYAGGKIDLFLAGWQVEPMRRLTFAQHHYLHLSRCFFGQDLRLHPCKWGRDIFTPGYFSLLHTA